MPYLEFNNKIYNKIPMSENTTAFSISIIKNMFLVAVKISTIDNDKKKG